MNVKGLPVYAYGTLVLESPSEQGAYAKFLQIQSKIQSEVETSCDVYNFPG